MPKQKDNQVVMYQVTPGSKVALQCKLEFPQANVTLLIELLLPSQITLIKTLIICFFLMLLTVPDTSRHMFSYLFIKSKSEKNSFLALF
jgi:hypothetical protein